MFFDNFSKINDSPKSLPRIQKEETSSESNQLKHTISLPQVHGHTFSAIPSGSRTSKRTSCSCKTNGVEDDCPNVGKLPAIPETNCLLLSRSKTEGSDFDVHLRDESCSEDGNIIQEPSCFKSLPHLENSVSFSTSFKVPSFSHLKLLHHTSTFKDTPLGYRRFISRKAAGSEQGDLQTMEVVDGIIEDKNNSKPVDFINSPQCASPSDYELSGNKKSTIERGNGILHLVNHKEKVSQKPKADAKMRKKVLNKVERFERLMKVLSLLKESKSLKEFEVGVGVGVSGESGDGSSGGLDALKEHIKSALDEAVRLRKETDTITY